MQPTTTTVATPPIFAPQHATPPTSTSSPEPWPPHSSAFVAYSTPPPPPPPLSVFSPTSHPPLTRPLFVHPLPVGPVAPVQPAAFPTYRWVPLPSVQPLPALPPPNPTSPSMRAPPSRSRLRSNPTPSHLSKRQSRLARKAELARASRRRKKDYIEGLHVRIMQLEWLVDQLKAANRGGFKWDESREDQAPVMRPSKRCTAEDDDEDDSSAGEEEPLSDTDSEPTLPSPTSCILRPPAAPVAQPASAVRQERSSVDAVIVHDSSSRHVQLPSPVSLSSMQDVILDAFPALSDPVILSYDHRDEKMRIISNDRELTKAVRHMQDTGEGVRLRLTAMRDRKRSRGRAKEERKATRCPRTEFTSDDSNDEQPARTKRQRTPAHTEVLPPKLSPPVPSIPNPYPPPSVTPAAIPSPSPLSTVWLEVVEGTSPRCVVSRFLVSLPLLSTFDGLRTHLQGVGLCGGREWGFEVRGRVLQENEEGVTMEGVRVEAGHTIRLVRRKEVVQGPALPLAKLGKAEEEAASAISSLAQIFISSREAQQAEAVNRIVGEVEAACA